MRRTLGARALPAILLTLLLVTAGCSEQVHSNEVSWSELVPASNTQGLFFDPASTEALAGELAAATKGSDWCIGWDVSVGMQQEFGSNLGVGKVATTCPKWIVVAADVHWVSESSESYDSAGLELFSNDAAMLAKVRRTPGVLDGVTPASLAGDNGDTVVANVVSSVALALAAKGELEPIAVTATKESDGVDLGDSGGEGGSDALNQNRTALFGGIAVLLAGVSVLLACMFGPRFGEKFRAAQRRAQEKQAGAVGPAGGNPRRILRQAFEAQQQAGPPPPPLQQAPGPHQQQPVPSQQTPGAPPTPVTAPAGSATPANPRTALRAALQAQPPSTLPPPPPPLSEEGTK